MPKVSIIIAVYNVEKYLRQCLDSLINQTLSDIEIVCTNDGSTDNSIEILKEYQVKDSRIKIIEQENQGPGIARNNALDIATGKYIMIVDPDDWLELDACELAYNQIEQNRNDLVIFDYKRYDNVKGEYIKDGDNFLPYRECINEPNIKLQNLRTNFFQNGYVWGKIFNREFLQKNSLRFLPLYLGEDSPLFLLSLVLSDSISIVNKPLYIYRVQDTTMSYNAARWKEFIKSRKYVADYLLNNNISESIICKYAEYMFISLVHWYNIFKKADSTIDKPYKKEMYACFDNVYRYMNTKTKFRYFIHKYRLAGIYYKLIRPIGKCCIVLPYRKIKARI